MRVKDGLALGNSVDTITIGFVTYFVRLVSNILGQEVESLYIVGGIASVKISLSELTMTKFIIRSIDDNRDHHIKYIRQ